MRKLLIAMGILVLVGTSAFIGYKAGYNHVIYNQTIQSESGFDVNYYATIDGETHEYFNEENYNSIMEEMN